MAREASLRPFNMLARRALAKNAYICKYGVRGEPSRSDGAIDKRSDLHAHMGMSSRCLMKVSSRSALLTDASIAFFASVPIAFAAPRQPSVNDNSTVA